MRYLAIVLFAAACTADTDTGQLAGFEDRMLAECRDDASSPAFSCGVRVTLQDGQLTAIGVFNDGSLGGPSAVGTLSDAAQLEVADLIAHIPTGGVAEPGCGGGEAPIRVTNVDVAFDHVGPRQFDIHDAFDGPMVELRGYVLSLVKEIRTCNATRVAFEDCAVNVETRSDRLSQEPIAAR